MKKVFLSAALALAVAGSWAFYRTKESFKTAVLRFFDRLSEFGPELASRMTLNFHVLDSQLSS